MANRDSRGRFVAGHEKRGGRQRGTQNKATRAWKDFVQSLVNDPEQQEALAEAIKGRPELLLKVAEHAVGRPRQQVAVETQDSLGGILARAASRGLGSDTRKKPRRRPDVA